MKKHITLILAIIATLCLSMFFVACDEQHEDNPPADTISVELNKTNVNMVLGTIDNLTAIYDVTDGYTLTWSSSDSSVVTVENGKLEAMKQGNVTITASYSNGTNTYSDTCNVVVGLGGNAPVLCIENNTSEDTWNILSGDALEIVPYVYFNGMKFYDVDIKVTSSQDNVISFENNTFSTVGKGSTSLVIEGSWRGIEFNGKNAMSIELDVNVLTNIEMALNGEAVNDVQLFTRESWGGKTYATSSPFVLTVKDNGVASSTPVDVVFEKEGIANYDNGVLSAVSYGQTNVNLSWSNAEGDTITKTITVFVDRPVDTYSATIENFSAIDGLALYDTNGDGKHEEVILTDILYGVGSNVNLIEATQAYYNYATKADIEADPLTINNGLLEGVFSNASGMQEVVLTLGTDTEVWVVNIKSASKVFAQCNIDDFVPTFTTTVNEGIGYTLYQDAGVVDKYLYFNTNSRRQGYYTLCENISGIETNGKNTSAYFAGNFDGRGYVISDITFTGGSSYTTTGGLFGKLTSIPDAGVDGKGAIIQNVAFTDVTFSGPYCTLLGYQAVGTSANHTIINNVYVQINKQEKFQNGTAPLFYTSKYLDMNNVIVDYPVDDVSSADHTDKDSLVFGSLIISLDYSKQPARQKLADVYVISKLALSHNHKNNDAELIYQDGSNTTTEGAYKVTGVCRYDTLADMKAAGNDYSTFSADYWTIVDGIPVFNALV